MDSYTVKQPEVYCEGDGIKHPKIYLKINKDKGYIVCPYCSKKFSLA